MKNIYISIKILFSRLVSFIFHKNNPLVYIHAGAPKTGTSMIQNWCVNNREFLSDEGIYYPEHRLDPNGISSGHRKLILSGKGNGRPDDRKIEDFLKLIRRRNEKEILITSECFGAHADYLLTAIPNSIIVYYIRSPLERFESGYNQRVKRHLFTKPISEICTNLSGFPKGIQKLVDCRAKYGVERFIFRLYDRQEFKGGNVLYDFFGLFDITPSSQSLSSDVNSSYCFEALEFARLVNRYKMNKRKRRDLDRLLQRYPNGIRNYSILTPSVFETFRHSVLESMKVLLDNLGFEQSEKERYLRNIVNQKQKEFKEQQLSEIDKNRILEYIKEQDTELFKALPKKVIS